MTSVPEGIADNVEPPRGLPWKTDADGKGGALRKRRSVQWLWTGGALWNVFALSMSRIPDRTIGVVGVSAILFFGYLAIRAVMNRTRVRFADGKFRCLVGPLFPTDTFEHDAADVERFVAVPFGPEKNPVARLLELFAKARYGFTVALVTRSGATLPLPINMNGIPIKASWRRQPYGVAPIDHAEFIAARLNEALEIARHEGGSYRIAPGFDVPHDVEAPREVEAPLGDAERTGDARAK